MRLIVGLGNPGKKYALNRHNIGFMGVDEIARDPNFSSWRTKFQGEISEGNLGGQKTLLLKPMTYMNLSGDAVQAAASFYKIAPLDIIVLHDELDLPPSRVKMKQGGGHAGHNGLRSIMAHIGADFWRLRMGIGHPGHKNRVSGYVLSDFANSDKVWLDPLIESIGRNAKHLVSLDAAKFIQALTPQKTTPKQKSKPVPKPKQETSEIEDERTPLQKLLDKFGKS